MPKKTEIISAIQNSLSAEVEANQQTTEQIVQRSQERKLTNAQKLQEEKQRKQIEIDAAIQRLKSWSEQLELKAGMEALSQMTGGGSVKVTTSTDNGIYYIYSFSIRSRYGRIKTVTGDIGGYYSGEWGTGGWSPSTQSVSFSKRELLEDSLVLKLDKSWRPESLAGNFEIHRWLREKGTLLSGPVFRQCTRALGLGSGSTEYPLEYFEHHNRKGVLIDMKNDDPISVKSKLDTFFTEGYKYLMAERESFQHRR